VPKRLRVETGQAALEWSGVLVIVAMILALVLSTGIPSQIAGALTGAVQSIVSAGPSGSAASGSGPGTTPTAPPAGITSFRDAQGRQWTWVPGGPVGPHWRVTGPHGAVSQVSPQGTLLSGAWLGAIAFPIVRVMHQGNVIEVETLDGSVYILQNAPEPGADQQDVQDVANQILSARDNVNNVAFVQRSRAAPRSDIVTYDSLTPGSTLNFVEVKNLKVDDDGQINAFSGAGNIYDAIRRQGANEVVVVLDTAPDPDSLLELLQRTNAYLASKGVRGTVTIAVRESGDVGVGPLHEAWTGELGTGVSSDETDSLDAGETAAQDDQPGDPQAGDPAPENPVDGGGDGSDPSDPFDPAAP
jgi:hypothetical protein